MYSSLNFLLENKTIMTEKLNKILKIITDNFLALWLLVVVTLFLAFTAYQNSLANFVWQKYRSPNLALLINRSDADLAMFVGNYYFNGVMGSREYNPDISQKAYEKAISINPKILWGHYQLARIYFIKGNFDNATQEINKELEANPENLRSLYVRGLIFGYRGNLVQAEADFRRFIEWAPKEWAGYNDLALILSKQGQYQEAEKTINLALKEALDAFKNPWLWNALGVAELNLKKYSAAINSFKKAGTLTEKLTVADWIKSYPGNDPGTAEAGLGAFKNAIKENLKRSERVYNSKKY